MKHFSTFSVIIVIAMIISACGAQPVPTVNPLDVQNTAIAAASTMVAQTLAAVPTATPLPPTEAPTLTPLPTNTPLVLPTQPVVLAPTTAPTKAASGGDPCATRVLGKPLGKLTIIRIWNNTKTPIQVSMYLNETEGHNECGYRSYTLGKNADVVITDLVYGCYNLWAWNTSGKPNFNSSGYGCINNPDKWTFEVNTAIVKFTGP